MKREWTIKDPFPFLQRKKFKIRSKYSLFFFAFIKDLFPEMVLYCDILIPPSSIHSDATPIYIIEREMLFLYIFLAFLPYRRHLLFYIFIILENYIPDTKLVDSVLILPEEYKQAVKTFIEVILWTYNIHFFKCQKDRSVENGCVLLTFPPSRVMFFAR